MANAIDRRDWLKKSSIVIAGLTLGTRSWERELRPPYVPGAPILLNSNENAYGPSPLARKAILEAYTNSNRYPDEVLPLLKQKIAAHWKVSEENILLGAGSSDIIGLACQHVSKPAGHIVVADPSYKVWNGQAGAFGLSFNRIPLNNRRTLDLSRMVDAVNGETRMVYVCNPNNPTGSFDATSDLADLAQRTSGKTMVFIDEAYTEFAELATLAPMAVKDPNVIVAKTFSKIYGLAGARVGYAIAHPETIKKLSTYQPWPDAGVSMVSAAAAMASLDDIDFVNDCRKKIATSRESCYAAFKELSIEYIPSVTNFILFNIDKLKGNFSDAMRARNIMVQFRDHFGGKWCRVSIGTTEEMQAFVKALKEIAAA